MCGGTMPGRRLICIHGLVAIDYENGLEKKTKKSYYWYKDVIETDGKHITGK